MFNSPVRDERNILLSLAGLTRMWSTHPALFRAILTPSRLCETKWPCGSPPRTLLSLSLSLSLYIYIYIYIRGVNELSRAVAAPLRHNASGPVGRRRASLPAGYESACETSTPPSRDPGRADMHARPTDRMSVLRMAGGSPQANRSG